MLGSSVILWDFCEIQKVKISFGTCKDPSQVPIYGPCGMENCIVILIETVFEAFEERKLFCLVLTMRYYGSSIRMEVFWPFNDLLMNDEVVVKVFNKGHVTMDGVNNLEKK